MGFHSWLIIPKYLLRLLVQLRLRQETTAAYLYLQGIKYLSPRQIAFFVSGLAAVLGPEGTITMEFPHLMRLMEENQFDTIYHEHFY